jgi:hypothetical protein
LFDADVLVIVVSSGDYADAPTFESGAGMSASSPGKKPVLALWEGFERYLLPRLKPERPPAALTASPAAAIEQCLGALAEMIEMGRKAGVKVIVVQHLEEGETLAKPLAGYAEINQRVRALGLEPVQAGPAFEAARVRGEKPLLDNIHPSLIGHRIMADVLVEAVEGALRKPATRETK